MTQTQALGSGPIVFFTDEGVQVEVPLSSLYFEDREIKANGTISTELMKFIKFQVARGEITAGPLPAATPALTVEALALGPKGNEIQIAVTPTDDDEVSVTVSTTETHRGLTLVTLAARLDAVEALVKVKTNPPAAPQPIDDDEVDPTPPVAPATESTTWTIAGAGADAVTLEARSKHAGYAFADFSLAIRDVSGTGAATTFTLEVTWSKTVEDVVAPSPATAFPALDAFRYLIKVKAPESGDFKLPRAATTTLYGGRAPAAAVAATATLLAND